MVAHSCIAPVDSSGETLCGAVATEQRVISGLIVYLCSEHAREIDSDGDYWLSREGEENDSN